MATDDLLIERLLRVVDEGRRTATYKMALLIALIDAAASLPGKSDIPTRLIAERVLGVYFPQTRPYIDRGGRARIPRQISMKSSAVLAAVEDLREMGARVGARSLSDIQRRMPEAVEATLEKVEDTFVRYPIPLLQVVGTAVVPFLYEVEWAEGTSLKSLRQQGRDRVRLLDGVADRLVVLGPMLRPLIELHWTRDVAKWSNIPTDDELLRTHLFGVNRVAFPSKLVGELRSLQGNECFYCGDRLGSRCEVDHFIAWSRWQNDAVQNLVVADRCNSAKSDHLAASGHLARWRARVELYAADLTGIADLCGWESAEGRTWALARSTYEHVAPDTPLWVRGKEFEFAAGPVW
jgi:hypothetical protein